MKTLKLSWIYVATLIMGLGLLGGSCSSDPEFDPSIEVSKPELSVNKKGVSSRGQVVTFDVTSNIYWVIDVPEEIDWLTLSPRAGYGNVNVKIAVEPNEGIERSVTLYLETKDGYKQPFTVTQGAAGDMIDYFTDSFDGEAVSEDIDVNTFRRWQKEGISYSSINYAGENTFVSSVNASKGYEGASGVNNVYFENANAEFSMSNFDTKGDANFTLRFGYAPSVSAPLQANAGRRMATRAAAAGDVKVMVSQDSEVWVEVAYTLSGEGTGWKEATAPFAIDPAIKKLYFKFVALKAGVRIDDVALVEGVDCPLIEFPTGSEELVGLPAVWSFPGATEAAAKGLLDLANNTYFSDDKKATLVADILPSNTGAKAMTYTEDSTPDVRALVTGMFVGDSWKFSVPVQNFAAGTNVNFKAKVSSSAKGPKLFTVEYSTDNSVWTAVNTKTVKLSLTTGVTRDVVCTFGLSDVAQEAENIDMNMVIPTAINNGTLYVRIKVCDAVTVDRTRDNTVGNAGTCRIRAFASLTTAEVVLPLEGLPVTWSMPETWVADGNVNVDEYWCKSDDTKATISAHRAKDPTSTSAKLPMSYTVLGAVNKDYGRLLMYSMRLGDSWKITIPVKHLAANTKLYLNSIMQSSGTGPKFWIVEYSTDNAATWVTVNTSTTNASEFISAQSREIIYTFIALSAAPTEIGQTFVVDKAIADGNLLIRLRVSDAMRADNNATSDLITESNAGTNRLTRATDVDSPPIVTVSVVE